MGLGMNGRRRHSGSGSPLFRSSPLVPLLNRYRNNEKRKYLSAVPVFHWTFAPSSKCAVSLEAWTKCKRSECRRWVGLLSCLKLPDELNFILINKSAERKSTLQTLGSAADRVRHTAARVRWPMHMWRNVNVFTIKAVSSPLKAYGGMGMINPDTMAATSNGMLETL